MWFFIQKIQVSINLDDNGICQRCDAEPLNEWSKSSDFPVINPAFSGSKNKYIYAAASSGSRSALPSFPFDMVVKLNASTKSVDTWSVGSRRFVGEPTFISKGSEEDEGYILVVEVIIQVKNYQTFNYFIFLAPSLQVQLHTIGNSIQRFIYAMFGCINCSMQLQFKGAIWLSWIQRRLGQLMHLWQDLKYPST